MYNRIRTKTPVINCAHEFTPMCGYVCMCVFMRECMRVYAGGTIFVCSAFFVILWRCLTPISLLNGAGGIVIDVIFPAAATGSPQRGRRQRREIQVVFEIKVVTLALDALAVVSL